MKSLELREKRANLATEARQILDTAEEEKRELEQEERERWDRLMDKINEMAGDIDRLERQEALDAELRSPVNVATRPEPGVEGREKGLNFEFVSRGLKEINQIDPKWMEREPLWRELFPYATDEYRGAFRSWVRGIERLRSEEIRALQVDSDTAGGYLVTPVQFVDRLIQAVDNLVYMRQWATVFSVPNADSLGAPSLDTDPADPTWTHELAIGSEDSSMAFGKRELHPHPLAKYIKISRTLLRKVPDAEGLVRSRLAYKFAVVAENAYLNGDGSGEPLGVFTASDYGISTGQDVSTGNAETEIRFDGLIEAKYTLKPQYWPKAKWMFHRDGVKQIAKLKDGEGQYLWRESVRVGEPDRILGLPVFMSEYAPSTFSTGEYVGILGDFSHYWIADSLAMEMQRLVELYAATNQIGLIGRLESDGMPVLEEAFVRVELA
jgi:HK97 family phage major capsid protein